MRILGWLLLLGCLLSALPVMAEDYTGSAFILRDPFLSLSGGVASSSSFVIYSQTGARIESGPSTGSVFRSTSGTESYPTYTSPVITATAGDTQVGLSWTASTTYFGGVITSYAVGQSLTSGGPYSYTNVGTSLSTTVTGLTNGSTYYFVIKAIDANQNQNTYSSEVSAIPVASTTPTGGGGDGGGATPRPRDTGAQGVVAFTGRAFPNGHIVLLKDGEIAAETQANSSATFQMNLENLSTGTYNFVLYGEDQAGRRSGSVPFRVSVNGSSTTNIAGVYLPPTLSVDKSQVKQGDKLSVTGQTVPLSTVTVFVGQPGNLTDQVLANADGTYTYVLSTSALSIGDYSVSAKSTLGNEASDFGTSVFFKVSDRSVPTPEGYLKADLNHDNRVNLVDFAIAGFWYKRDLSAAFLPEEAKYLNGDGKIDLTDFAIMAFYWTG